MEDKIAEILKNHGRIRIGLSNTAIPGNKKSFPPEFRLKSRLHYYATLFDTLEVNSCFYKTPMLTTYKRWSLDVPRDFQFTLKLSKEATHAKTLDSDLACLDKFLHTASGTGDKKGCILIQFPGKITLNYYEKVETILSEVTKHDPGNYWRKAVEFRNNSWYTREAWDLLDEYNATMVLHDMRKAKMMELAGNASFVYIRFHGPAGDYRGSYTDEFLQEKALEIQSWAASGKDVYVYFNNTAGNAFENALSLKMMLR